MRNNTLKPLAKSAANPAANAASYDIPPLMWLRAFEASARHSSFTAAADELSLTPAAVSHQVRSLEKYLGVMLFERLARKLLLTELGTAYLPPLRQSFDNLAAATAGLFGPIGQRTLMVRAPVSFVSLWLAPRIAGFLQKYPGIRLRLTSSVWSHSQSDEGTDIDIRFGDGTWPGFRADPIASFKAVPVCHPDQAPAGDFHDRIGQLSRSPLIHVTGYEDLWQRLCGRAEIPLQPYQGLIVDTSIAALELAAAGYGPAIVLDCFARHYIDSGRLVMPVEAHLAVDSAHYILTPDTAKRPSPEAILFTNWVKQLQ